MVRVGVIGSGSYGTCLAILLGEAGHEVHLWARKPEFAEALARDRENTDYLPGYRIPESVTPTSMLETAVAGKDIVVGVTPSHAARPVLGEAAQWMGPDTVVVNASKGLEEGTFDRIDEIYAEIFPERISGRACYLSGPTFAKEVAAGAPSAIVVAGRDPETVRYVQQQFSTERFRVYGDDDVVGVQIGGALKNVVAIAAGISDGLGFGHNARAALITRGLAEISRIGAKLGANPLTFAGLSGMGDLVLTCAGDLSRNRRVGLALGAGKKLDEIVGEMKMVAEGVKTTKVAHNLAAKLGVEAPIADFVYAILYENLPAKEGIARLMGRSLKAEKG
ncbi:MAG: NAD(P)-dependent glycerol-3-phosphate dehydrogenase [Deltaproteobacteria bacterium]|nr:NAD(P)-dependent glycerol-3-phosphate dehydrogenase [Deltaproteobacteria bacterium]